MPVRLAAEGQGLKGIFLQRYDHVSLLKVFYGGTPQAFILF
jgi:hypothetical protein